MIYKMRTYLLLLLRPDDLEGAEALAGAAETAAASLFLAEAAAASLFLAEAAPSLVAAAAAAVASFCFALSAAEEDDCGFLPLLPFSW